MRVLLLSGLLISFLAPTARASWPSDPTQNVPLCTADRLQWQNLAVTDGLGGAIIAWADDRLSPPTYDHASVFAQRVDGAGGTHWAANGAAVFINTTDYVNFDALCSDGAGGAFLAWIVSPDSEAVRVQHIDASGVPSWAASGIRVGKARSYVGVSCLVADGVGGVIVAWNSLEGDGSTYGVRGQRLDSSGARLWGTNGVILGAPGPEMPIRPVAVSDGQGGALVLWRQSPLDGTWKILLVHALGTGVVEAGAGGPIIRSGSSPPPTPGSPLPTPVACSDGASGEFVAWVERDGLNTAHLLAERFDGSGSALWAPIEVVARIRTGSVPGIQEPILVRSGPGDAIVGWFESGAPASGLRAQRVTAAGSVSWSQGGVFVSGPPDFGENSLQAVSDGADGAMFAYVVWKSSGPYLVTSDITAARVTSSGYAPWAAHGVGICTHDYNQVTPAIVADGANGAIISWEDDRSGNTSTLGPDIYMQNVRGDGTIGDGVAGVESGSTDFTARVWPVPSSGGANIAFSSRAGSVSVTIVDVSGRRVCDVMHASVGVGEHVLRWDGIDDRGAPVAPGLYLVHIRSGNRETTRRIVLLERR